jgi:hypothetical protein
MYELTDREILFDTSIDTSKLPDIKKELAGKAFFFDNWVYVPNVDKYNSYRNSPKNEKAFIKEISYVPLTVLQHFIDDTSIDTSIDTDPILLEIRNKKSEIKNKESKIRNNKPEILNKESEIKEKDLEETKKKLYEQMNWK